MTGSSAVFVVVGRAGAVVSYSANYCHGALSKAFDRDRHRDKTNCYRYFFPAIWRISYTEDHGLEIEIGRSIHIRLGWGTLGLAGWSPAIR